MTTIDRLDRRGFVTVTATVAATGFLAGCADDDGGGGGDEFLDDEPDYGGFMDDANGYERTLDMTGSDRIEIDVGADGGLSYAPAAVAVSPGTTVVWEWTGEGGAHDVSAVDDAFQSENVDQDGFTFEHTFDSEGVYEYVCTPHEAVGMKGAVVVQ